MAVTLLEQKAELRKQIKLRIEGISAEAKKSASRAACSLLRSQQVWKQSSSVLFYAPMAAEIDVWPLLEESLIDGKTVALPQFDATTKQYKVCQIRDLGQELCAGQYGIREPIQGCAPVALNRLDFILVPGVAFDLHGRRLGRGKGYYDYLLAAVRGRTCGVAFDEQIVSAIPVEPHDSDLNCILTPTRWIEL